MKLKRVSVERFKQIIKEDPSVDNLLIPKACVCDSIKSSGEEKRTLVFTMSTGKVDRENDKIDPNGWNLKAFKKSGPMLWGHDARLPNIGIARNAWLEDEKLKGRIEFTGDDIVHPFGTGFGDSVYRMYRDGFLKTVSVGFRSTEWVYNEDRKNGIDFIKQELLELSAVPIPANPDAMVEAGRKGVDIQPIYEWITKELDDGQSLIVSRDLLEESYKTLKQQFSCIGKPNKHTELSLVIKPELDEKTWSPIRKFLDLFDKRGDDKEIDQKGDKVSVDELKELNKRIDGLDEMLCEIKSCIDCIGEDISRKHEMELDALESRLKSSKDKELDEAINKMRADFDNQTEQLVNGISKMFADNVGKLISKKLSAYTGILDD